VRWPYDGDGDGDDDDDDETTAMQQWAESC